MVSGCLTISRTKDMFCVKQLMTDAELYPHMRDDGCAKNPSDWHPVYNQHHYFLIPWLHQPDCDPIPVGIVAFYAINFVLYEIHIGILHNFRHWRTKDIVSQAIEWVFDSTPCQTIIAWIPENKPALKHIALASGFTQQVILPNSFQLDQKLNALIMMTKTRG